MRPEELCYRRSCEQQQRIFNPAKYTYAHNNDGRQTLPRYTISILATTTRSSCEFSESSYPDSHQNYGAGRMTRTSSFFGTVTNNGSNGMSHSWNLIADNPLSKRERFTITFIFLLGPSLFYLYNHNRSVAPNIIIKNCQTSEVQSVEDSRYGAAEHLAPQSLLGYVTLIEMPQEYLCNDRSYIYANMIVRFSPIATPY